MKEIVCTGNAVLGVILLLGLVGCESLSGTCTYGERTFALGDRFDADDGCNTCSCEAEGGVACTEMGCLPKGPCEEAECGPRPGMPNYQCEDGVTIAGPGECERGEDEVCGWKVVQCPPEGCDVEGADQCVERYGCEWLLPGCAEGDQSAVLEGCYPIDGCEETGDCSEGEACRELIYDPCPSVEDGSNCDACGATVLHCVGEEDPCDLECEFGPKQDSLGHTYCECLPSDFCVQVVPPDHRDPEGGECIPFPTPCNIPDGWVECESNGP